MLKKIVGTLALSLAALAAVPSEAALMDVSGYVCSTTYTKQNNVAFGQGWVRVTLYTAPFCGGSFVAQLYVLGPGATFLGFQHTQEERLALFERAHAAAIAGKRGTFWSDMPNGGIFHHTYHAN
jgi:hypothetical protein